MARGFSYLVLVLCGIWVQAIAVISSNSTPDAVGELRSTLHGSYLAPTLHSRDAKVDLRILCLGASITWGVGSSTGNGYRKPLSDKLRFEGYEVDMVGTKHNGDMADNVRPFGMTYQRRERTLTSHQDVEARPGGVIDQVHTAARGSYRYNPNVVLINAGTNDCLQNRDIAGAGERMRVPIEDIFQSISGVTVLLSTLIPCKDPTGEANRPAVNAQYRTLVSGKRIDDDKANEVFSNAQDKPEEYVVNEELKHQVVTIIEAWDNATGKMQSSLFSGTSDGISQLGKMIAGGTFLLPNDTQLLPITDLKASAWRLAIGDINPFVIDSTMNCEDALDQESKDTNPEGFGSRALTDYDTSRVCINDRMYSLVTATKPRHNCVDSPHEGLGHYCHAFRPPPGTDALDGSFWGNITIEDIVAGNTFAGIGKSDVSAPGYVDIPMCRYWEARENYWYWRGSSSHDEVPYYFPCNEIIDYNS
ncbi:hypothetical protein Asppvi_005441 [Aspergillus pseudoviridinutans]|uniref:SGNH hydrolase-type esterase domain-containing protein n=1 Tax=Aspergillus pseudoviridinutans TaxID=1517512 RepID=A0A9P3B880_9EURO|nr:uncharacterized protein Asppvi_005441 [Aspergillus pseudoviridinutans]GIJ86552.1 hypothetical protein Asppvi_005441 [Aspergillus pseudoviridinutans]